MAGRLTINALGILSWMKEHQAEAETSLDEMATRLDVSRGEMQRSLQWLQRYECVKRGGRENAAWSITDQGLVRLAEGRFSPSGGLLSPFDLAEAFAGSNQDQARPSSVSTVPETTESGPSDTERVRLLPFWK